MPSTSKRPTANFPSSTWCPSPAEPPTVAHDGRSRHSMIRSWPFPRQARSWAEEDHSPGSALAQQATRRPQAAALLTVILLGSRLEHRGGWPLFVGAVGGRDGGRPVTGGA